MYAMINTIGTAQVKPGDPVILKYDSQFGKVGAFAIDGYMHGFLSEGQPAGCVDEWTVYSHIGCFRVIARAAVVMDGKLLLQTDSPLFAHEEKYARVERAGYGMLVHA